MNTTILGAGTMGRWLAWFFAKNGVTTILYDPYEEALSTSQEELKISSNLKYTTDLTMAVSDADFVIESAPEDIKIKRDLYAKIAPLLKKEAVVASNTSTFPLVILSGQQPFAKRMLITHFFNPAHIIPLVEIVQTEQTDEGLAERISLFLSRCGKIPVILKKDINGFVANRLQAAVLREACYLVAEGIVDSSDIDVVMKEGIGLRWALSGPFEIADYGGLDIWEMVLKNLLPLLDSTVDVPDIISEKVKNHNLGLKTGGGFFSYDLNSGLDLVRKRNNELIQLLKLRI